MGVQARLAQGAKDRSIIGFASRRYFDAKYGCYLVKVLPGEYYITKDPEEMIVTVLGSCISACIRDTVTGVGGMNHFMLPARRGEVSDHSDPALRYGDYAMELLINNVLKAGSGQRKALEIKLFGGGQVIKTKSDIGKKNAEFARAYLEREGLRIDSEDVGTSYARRIHYFPLTGKVMRRFITEEADTGVAAEETAYESEIVTQDKSGDIELFTD